MRFIVSISVAVRRIAVTAFGIINEVTLRRARLVLGWVTHFRAGIPPRYVTNHPGQLSLLPSAGREMSTDQSAVMLCGWGVKSRCCSFSLWISKWVAGKTV